MSADERILRLENAFATLSELAAHSQEVDARHEARFNTLAESNRLIVEMIRRHDERVDEFRAGRAETDQKLAALVDAQIRAEDEMSKVRAAQAEFKSSLDELRGALVRVTAAQEVSERGIAQVAEAQARTEAALERLSQTVEAILRNGRGGQSLA